MNILVINAGSSSLKYQLIEMDREQVLAKGICERINIAGSEVTHKTFDGRSIQKSIELNSHKQAFDVVVDLLLSPKFGVLKSLSDVAAVGHRVVQGAEKFKESVVVDDSVLQEIKNLSVLAPLHNLAHAQAIEACRLALGENVFQVAVFDSAFHQTIPVYAYLYGLPYEAYTKYRVRKYGFHGTSHRYVSLKVSKIIGRPLSELKIVSCHLGNGSSICAIKFGESVDCSMGLTPLDGVLMGTRCGSVDPSAVTFLMEKQGLTLAQMNRLMNGESGLLGISGVGSDFRDVTKAARAGNERAKIAIEMLVYQVRKRICAAMAAMDGADVVLFTGGIAENSDFLRSKICSDLSFLGVDLSEAENSNKLQGREGLISSSNSKIKVFVVATNEELMIARDTLGLLEKSGKV